MSPTDLLGFAGVSLILLAFFLNLKKVLDTDHFAYILLNTVGAALACLASILMQYLPFVLLEGVWLIVSGRALWKRWKVYQRQRSGGLRNDLYV